MKVSHAIYDFVTLAIDSGGYMAMDRVYLSNRLKDLIGVENSVPIVKKTNTIDFFEVINTLINTALLNKKIKQSEREVFKAELTDLLTPPPSVVNAYFAEHYHQSPQAATDYLYNLLENSGYFSGFEIKQSTCNFCAENEGLVKRSDGYSQINLRFIRMNLDEESWYFQFLSKGHFKQHAAISSENHQPLELNVVTLKRQLKITELFPHFFVLLTSDDCLRHGHYQLGLESLPIEKAKVHHSFEIKKYLGVSFEQLVWHNFVIRLRGYNVNELAEVSELIIERWQLINGNTSFVIMTKVIENQFVVYFIVTDEQVSLYETVMPTVGQEQLNEYKEFITSLLDN